MLRARKTNRPPSPDFDFTPFIYPDDPPYSPEDKLGTSARPALSVTMVTAPPQIPLIVAIQSGKFERAKELALTCNVNQRDSTTGETPLMAAVRARWPEGIRLLLARHADINIANHDGNTAAMMAVGDEEITRVLLETWEAREFELPPISLRVQQLRVRIERQRHTTSSPPLPLQEDVQRKIFFDT